MKINSEEFRVRPGEKLRLKKWPTCTKPCYMSKEDYQEILGEHIEGRKLWKHYTKAYEACLSETSTKHGPWYVVPADDKENARLIVSRVILDTLKELKMSYPEPTKARRKELLSIRKLLAK